MSAPFSRALVVEQPKFTRVERADIVTQSNSFYYRTRPLVLNKSGTRTRQCICNLLITKQLESWRRGESEYSGLLKTRRLLISRGAQNALVKLRPTGT